MDFGDNITPMDDFSNDIDSQYIISHDENQGMIFQNTPEDSVTYSFDEADVSTNSINISKSSSAPVIIEPHTIQDITPTTKKSPNPEKKKRAPRKKKDPNAPATVVSAYTLFFRDKAATIKEQNPKAKFGDISKIVSQLWEALGESEKAVYKKRNADDKIRFQREMEAYKAGLNVQQVEREEELQDEVTKEVFTSTELTTDVSSHATKLIQPEEKTENDCIRTGCQNSAIKSPEWDDEYCSNDCAVGHCKDVFALWVAEQRASS